MKRVNVDGSENLLWEFIYGPGIDEPICMVDVADSNAGYYYHFDGLGSVAALSDVNNVIVESYSYDVFGAPTIYDANYTEISSSAIGSPYLFTARRADDETALYYYRARYYAFDIGRFLQTDPTGYTDGLNLYAYVGNNPLMWGDPYGLCKAESELQQSALGRAILGLSGFGVGFGEAVTSFLGGLPGSLKHALLDPDPLTLNPTDQLMHTLETATNLYNAGQQFRADITSPDAERNGLAIGRLTGYIFSAGLAAEATAGITRKVQSRIALRQNTLKPTLDRIKAGGRFPHRNDGSIFRNYKEPLPPRPPGYYREYVHPTPGVTGPGVQRIVTGQGGEIYYTPDHYKSFTRVR